MEQIMSKFSELSHQQKKSAEKMEVLRKLSILSNKKSSIDNHLEPERHLSEVIADPNNYDQIKTIADFIRKALDIPDSGKYTNNNNNKNNNNMINMIKNDNLPNFDDKKIIGIICGSGLGALADHISRARSIAYEDIPGFPVSTVSGHKGKLIYGDLENKRVLCLQGRIHTYEGYSPAECSVPIRVMKLLDVSLILMTSAVGGLNQSYQQGDVMLVKDHLFLPGFGMRSPLRGPNDERFGPRFPTMNNCYDRVLRDLAKKIAAELVEEKEEEKTEEHHSLTVHEGVYAMVGGPQFETPTECRLLKMVGADAVGMSLCHETIVARHCDIKVMALTLITNRSILDIDHIPRVKSFHNEVLQEGEKASERVNRLVKSILRSL